MTNPTPPLTAEDTLRQLMQARYVNNCCEYLEGLDKCTPDGYADTSLKKYWESATSLIKAYAAQQNAELVAKLYGLRKELSETDQRLLKIEAENERLQSQVKLMHAENDWMHGLLAELGAEFAGLEAEIKRLEQQLAKEVT